MTILARFSVSCSANGELRCFRSWRGDLPGGARGTIRFRIVVHRRVNRQPNLEAGVAWLGDDADIPTVAADDDAVAHVQAEARALTDVLGGEERLEDALFNIFRYAGTVIRDLDQ